MSEENVEIVRRVVDAFNAGDRDRLLGFVDPDMEFRSAVEQRTYRGRDALLQYREDLDATLQEFHTEGDRFLDAGGERVVHLYRVVGRGAGSGVPVSRDVAAVWHLRDGKVLKSRIYLDQRQALEAAGLSE
jgi:ketosteroid isomerase-like protein